MNYSRVHEIHAFIKYTTCGEDHFNLRLVFVKTEQEMEKRKRGKSEEKGEDE